MARNLGIPCTEEKPYYFISYNSEDKSTVSEYVKELAKLNVPMWYDKGLKLGKEWENEIADRIDNCQAVIMFLSRNIFEKKSSYVHKEFELATEYSNKKVFVIMLDKINKPDVPVRFRGWWTSITSLHYIDAFEYQTEKECVQALVSSMEDVLDEPVTVENQIHENLAYEFEQGNADYEKYAIRVVMCADVYDLDVNELLAGFSKWLFHNMENHDEAYECIKAFLKMSYLLEKENNIYEKILYCRSLHKCSDKKRLKEIIGALESDRRFDSMDKFVKGLYRRVLSLYSEYVEEAI